jgi:hypothetical protein
MITVTDEPAGTLIRVDGWLAGEGVAELAQVLDAAAGPARLLLRDLRGADAAGLSVLRRLSSEGTPFEGLSTYIQLMLATPASLEPFPAPPVIRPETPVRSDQT